MMRSRHGLFSGIGDHVQPEERDEVRGAAAGAVAGLGVVYLVPHLALSNLSATRALLELPFLLLSLTLVYAGYWLLRCDFRPARVGRIAAWSLAGFLGLVAITVWIVAGQNTPVQHSLATTVNVGAVGASSGLLVGLENERRNGHLDRDATDASRAARRAEDRFDFFNRLLRHHLLNGLAVVSGHAELLAEADDAPEGVHIIRRRSQEIVDLVRNVETLGRAFSGDLPRRPVDPLVALETAVETVTRERPSAAVDTSVDDLPAVVGHERLDVALESLLRLALDAADADSVAVSTGTVQGAVQVTFSFVGAVPTVATADPGTRGEEHLGLFLSETLIDYFGGRVDIDGPAPTAAPAADGRCEVRVRLRPAA